MTWQRCIGVLYEDPQNPGRYIGLYVSCIRRANRETGMCKRHRQAVSDGAALSAATVMMEAGL